MIALLRGRVAAASLGRVVVDVAGVGYRVLVPPATGARAGEDITLHTFLAVRDDALTLYGFVQEADRDLFEVLLSVTGVGPKLALAAIATLGAAGLRRAVVAEDVNGLVAIPGVGRKGAQRMILELRDRLGAVGPGGVPGDASADGLPADARAEVREALATLGYAPVEVQRTLDALPAVMADGDRHQTAEQVLRAALRRLGADR